MQSGKNGKIVRIDIYPDQVVVYFDGGVEILSKQHFDEHPFHVGDQFIANDQAMHTSTYDMGIEKAYQWLAIRDYPVHEMTMKLHDVINEKSVVEQVIHTLLQRGVINDHSYAHQQLTKVLEMGYGSTHLREVLTNKQIPNDIIDEVINAYSNQQEDELARTLINQWVNVSTLQQKAPSAFAGALMNRLKTRGFRSDTLEYLQEWIIELARAKTSYSISDQIKVFQRLKFSAAKQRQKLAQLGFDEEVISTHLQEVQYD